MLKHKIHSRHQPRLEIGIAQPDAQGLELLKRIAVPLQLYVRRFVIARFFIHRFLSVLIPFNYRHASVIVNTFFHAFSHKVRNYLSIQDLQMKIFFLNYRYDQTN